MLYGNHCNNIRNHRSDRIPYVDKYIGLFITSAFVVVLRLLASRFRWEIPKAEDVSLHHTKNHSGKE